MPACGYHTDKGVRYFMPGCMGGAAMGASHCTCKTSKQSRSREKDLYSRIEALEEQVRALTLAKQ